MLMFDAWTGKDLQRTLALLWHMEAEGITSPAWMRDRLQHALNSRLLVDRSVNSKTKLAARRLRASLRCSSCGSGNVLIAPVNVSRCSRVGGSWRAAIECRNEQCRHVEFSTRTVREIVDNAVNPAGRRKSCR